ncbi:hypothetical protein GCM10011394_09790 [Luteimonas terricola]|uniref:Uncharacterized protein n=1 Tax=Luteimonas terricola TaxID=645597 RepID=A0ABQ2EA37_9GAMM|nr:hypothetical protein GCM10011394_09790 [Luteimonas terricola]
MSYRLAASRAFRSGATIIAVSALHCRLCARKRFGKVRQRCHRPTGGPLSRSDRLHPRGHPHGVFPRTRAWPGFLPAPMARRASTPALASNGSGGLDVSNDRKAPQPA